MKRLTLVFILSLLIPSVLPAQFNLGGIKGDNKRIITAAASKTVDNDNNLLIITLRFDMPDDVYTYKSQKQFFRVAETSSKGLATQYRISLPQASKHLNFDGTSVDVFTNNQVITIRRSIVSPKWEMSGYLQFQACNKDMCFSPQKVPFSFKSGDDGEEEKAVLKDIEKKENLSGWQLTLENFKIRNSEAGYKNKDEFINFLETTSAAGNPFAGKSTWLIILLILIGGLALNLTPCVLPMIPVNIAIIGAGAKSGSKFKGFFTGLTYGAGMTLAYGALGLVVMLTGSQFGALNASPWFNFGIALLFIVLALGMLNIIPIDFSRLRGGSKGSDKKTLATVFFIGALAALLAGACIAPVVLSVILYASALYADGNILGLFLPFLLGAGMSLPWPILGAGISILPKPGAWMEKVKYIFGIVIIGFAIYYGAAAIKILNQRAGVTSFSESKEAVADLEKGALPAARGVLPWSYDLESSLQLGLKEDKPVLIDFWASWCKNCVVMDKTTFKEEEVIGKLKNYILIKYKAEDPADPETKAVLDHFGVIGLPTYIVLEKK